MRVTFDEFLNEERNLSETSLSRVREHMLNHDAGVITAFRDALDCGEGEKLSRKDNKARNKVLLANLRKEGYSVTKAKGSFIENYGTKDAKEVGENVFIVVDINDKGNLKKKLMELGEKFEQDSILFIPQGGEEGYLIGTNKCPDTYPGYHQVEKLNRPLFGKEGEFLTRVKGRPFVLENIGEKVPSLGNNLGKWGNSILANKDWRDVEINEED